MSVQVFKTGVDEWLKMCQYFAQLAHQYCPDAQSPSASKKKRKGKDTKKVGKGDKSKQDLPAVEEILGLQLGDSARRGKSGMVFALPCRPMTCPTMERHEMYTSHPDPPFLPPSPPPTLPSSPPPPPPPLRPLPRLHPFPPC